MISQVLDVSMVAQTVKISLVLEFKWVEPRLVVTDLALNSTDSYLPVVQRKGKKMLWWPDLFVYKLVKFERQEVLSDILNFKVGSINRIILHRRHRVMSSFLRNLEFRMLDCDYGLLG